MSGERNIRVNVVSIDGGVSAREINLDDESEMALFLKKVNDGLIKELENGIIIPPSMKRTREGRPRSRRQMLEVLQNLDSDYRRLTEAISNPNLDNLFIISIDENGQPLTVSLPDRRKVSPKGKIKMSNLR